MSEMNTTDYGANIPTVLGDIDTLAVTVDRALTEAEVAQVSGCIGYALRTQINGEDLSDPVAILRRSGSTVITYWYDSTKGQRSSRDVQTALCLAARYIVEGTPVRTTNRAGAGTRGTRLVQGIGLVGLSFAVDIDPELPDPTPPTGAAQRVPDVSELVAARLALQAAQRRFAEAAMRFAGAGL